VLLEFSITDFRCALHLGSHLPFLVEHDDGGRFWYSMNHSFELLARAHSLFLNPLRRQSEWAGPFPKPPSPFPNLRSSRPFGTPRPSRGFPDVLCPDLLFLPSSIVSECKAPAGLSPLRTGLLSWLSLRVSFPFVFIVVILSLGWSEPLFFLSVLARRDTPASQPRGDVADSPGSDKHLIAHYFCLALYDNLSRRSMGGQLPWPEFILPGRRYVFPTQLRT